MKRAWAAVGFAVLVIAWWHAGGRTTTHTATDDAGVAAEQATARHPTRPSTLVAGHVTRTSDGASIPDATITIASETYALVEVRPFVATSDRDGNWTTSIPPGEYSVAVMAEGFVPRVIEHVPIVAGSHVDAVLDAGGWLVSGTVTDIGGGPVPAARVTVSVNGRAVTALTHADGRYRLSVPDGEYTATASHAAYASQDRGLFVAGHPVTVQFSLVPGGEIRGVVVARDTGQPVRDAIVETSTRFGRNLASTSVMAEADGSFVVDGLAPGAISIEARGRGYATSQPTTIDLGIGERADAVRILAEHAATISGRATTTDGTAVVGASMTAQTRQYREIPARDLTDSSGAFEILGVRSERYSIGGHAGELSGTSEITQIDGDVRDVVVVLAARKGTTVTGRVEPAMVAAIDIDGDSTTTDGSGSFSLHEIGPGPHLLTATTTDFRIATREIIVTGEPLSNLVVQLAAGATIAGSVVDDTGAPIADARVIAYSVVKGRIETSRRTATDVTGRFRMQGLPERKVTLQALDNPTEVDLVEVDLHTGAEVRDVKLTLPSRRGEITGRVTDADGAPVTDAWVNAERGFGAVTDAVATRADGTFVIKRLALRKYTVVAYGPRGDTRGEAKASTGEQVVIQLDPLGAIAGRVTQGGAPVSVFDLRCRWGEIDRHVVSADGTFSVDHLEPGHYDCTATSSDGSATGSATVGSGVVPLELRMPRTASAHGTAIDALRGTPLAGVHVALQSSSSDDWDQVTTSANGEFTVVRIPASGTVLFAASTPYTHLGMVDFTAVEGQQLELGVVRLAPPPASPMGWLGMFVDKRSTTASRVDDGGPAELAGIRVGDEIVSIDGASMAGCADGAPFYALSFGIAVGQTVKLGLARGDTVSVTAIVWPH